VAESSAAAHVGRVSPLLCCSKFRRPAVRCALRVVSGPTGASSIEVRRVGCAGYRIYTRCG
jgi:hypothetical protein